MTGKSVANWKIDIATKSNHIDKRKQLRREDKGIGSMSIETTCTAHQEQFNFHCSGALAVRNILRKCNVISWEVIT